MDEFQFIDTQGQTQTITASSPSDAIRLAPNRAPTSGVRSVQSSVNQQSPSQVTEPQLTGTSDGARAETTALQRDIEKMGDEGPDFRRIQQLAEQEQQLIADQRDRLEKQRAEEVAGIRTEFAELQNLTEEEQTKEFAGRNVGLITQAGGALGLPQSQ